jgi:hypothetical protein
VDLSLTPFDSPKFKPYIFSSHGAGIFNNLVTRSLLHIRKHYQFAPKYFNHVAVGDLVIIAACQLKQWAYMDPSVHLLFIMIVREMLISGIPVDFDGNQQRIIESIRQAKAASASLRVGPELEITGEYSLI